MREIKFRAWNKETNHMVTDKFSMASIMRDKIGQAVDCNGKPIGAQYMVMQFTGLKDSRGKAIFEGDFVSIYELGVYEVVFKEGCFGAEDGGGFSPFRGSIWGLGGEVIGNIYENPNC